VSVFPGSAFICIRARLESGEVDFVIATEGQDLYQNLVMLPCSRWNRAVIVKPDHALYKVSQLDSLTLEALTQFPIITYVFGFTGRSQLDRAFQARDLKPKVVLTATDADVIKTYVRSGLGVGIIAHMAYEPSLDGDLKALDASHLFDSSVTHIGMRKHRKLRERVDKALDASSARELDRIFESLELPVS